MTSQFLCPNCKGLVQDDCPHRECGDYDCFYCPACEREFVTNAELATLIFADTASGVQALAQTASESASGDVLLPATFDDVDDTEMTNGQAGVIRKGITTLANMIERRNEEIDAKDATIDRLTRDLAAANAKIESALGVERKDETDVHGESHRWLVTGFNDCRAIMRKRLTTDTSTPQS